MKLFGQFLIEKKAISEDALLSALMEQMSSLPSVAQIVYDKKILPPTQILQVLAHQTTKKIEFKAACEELGFWNSEVNDSIENELKNCRIPIGQILVKQNHLTFQAITRALDDYLAETNEEKPALEVTEPVPPSSPATSEATVPVPLIKEPLLENTFPKIDSELLKNYSELLNEKQVAVFEGLFDSSKKAALEKDRANALKEVFHPIVKGFHEVRGMGRFLKITLTEQLASEIETAVLSGMKTATEMEVAEVDMVVSLASDGLKMVRAIQKSLIDTGSEALFWETEKEKFESLCKALRDLTAFFSSKPNQEEIQMKEAA